MARVEDHAQYRASVNLLVTAPHANRVKADIWRRPVLNLSFWELGTIDRDSKKQSQAHPRHAIRSNLTGANVPDAELLRSSPIRCK
jgi:hypothetical protein